MTSSLFCRTLASNLGAPLAVTSHLYVPAVSSVTLRRTTRFMLELLICRERT